GKWDEDIKKQSDTCKNLKTDEPRHSEIVCKPCPGIDYVCSCAELCQEKGLHYQNKRFGAENPKPLTEIVDDVLAKDQ
ncbi:hypothetical protein KY325_04435, partial [Candidatus Woesearchaeota archaeon]|nr:hypothetical protein [Candidatus Woesearchaeota archaeon]